MLKIEPEMEPDRIFDDQYRSKPVRPVTDRSTSNWPDYG